MKHPRFTSLVLSTSMAVLSGCAVHQPVTTPTVPETGPFVSQFQSCKAEGLALDQSAKQQASPAQYLAAANTLDQCLTEVDAHRDAIPLEERMQVHALSILDYVKGGDVQMAQTQLKAFEMTYAGKDLYLSDYSSFTDSFKLILGETDLEQGSGALNVSDELKSEIARKEHW